MNKQQKLYFYRMITIRKGAKGDLPKVLTLVKELAEYEKAADQVENTVEEMLQDGFGPNPVYFLLVAEENAEIIGIAIYYIKYSTWKGKCVFLEDIIVTESQRGKGTGALLFEEVIKIAKEMKVRRLEWQVLDWNEPAIRFYKKYGSNLDPQWVNGKLTYAQLQEL
jgi:GNAT superfamily N-acetyltransferase